MLNKILRKSINAPLWVLRRIKYHTLRSTLPISSSVIPSFVYVLFFKFGVLLYQKFFSCNNKNELLTLKTNKIFDLFNIFETIKNSNNKRILVDIILKTNNKREIGDIISLLLLTKNNFITSISLEFQKENDAVLSYNDKQEKNAITYFSYNQLSTLPSSYYRDVNLFLKRAPYYKTLLVINLSAEINKDILSLFENVPNNIRIVINNFNKHLENDIKHPNIVNLDQCGFSLPEKIIICQHADFYFGVYDSLALGAFDANSKGTIYLSENETSYFTKEDKNFNLKGLDKINSIKDIEDDIINSLQMDAKL